MRDLINDLAVTLLIDLYIELYMDIGTILSKIIYSFNSTDINTFHIFLIRIR